MDKLKEIYNSVKERLTNPLLFSFLCAWLLWNWEIPIALLYYKEGVLSGENTSNLFQFIRSHFNAGSSLLRPAVVAIVYTISFPFLKGLIRLLNVWIEQKIDNKALQINRDGKVSIDKYIRIKENYDKRTLFLEEVISSESATVAQLDAERDNLNRANDNINQLKSELVRMESKLSSLRDAIDVRMLDGQWRYDWKSPELGNTVSVNILIKDGMYYVQTRGGKSEHIFNIVSFRFDTTTNRVEFVKDRFNQAVISKEVGYIVELKYYYNDLQIRSDGALVGKENGTTMVTYTKRDLS